MKIRHNVQDDFSKISKLSLFGHYKAKTKLRKKRPKLSDQISLSKTFDKLKTGFSKDIYKKVIM